MARRKKQTQLTDPDAPVKCKFCEADLTDAILGDPPVCPYCGEAVKLKDKPIVIENVTETVEEKPNGAKVVSSSVPLTTNYGIAMNVHIPQISEIEINKVAIAKDGKMLTKLTIEVENLNEVSLLRIIHMMNARVRMHVAIGADHIQTDFLDLIDPKTTKEALAQVSRKDLEDKGVIPVAEVKVETVGDNGNFTGEPLNDMGIVTETVEALED